LTLGGGGIKGNQVRRVYISEQSEIFPEQAIIKLQTCHYSLLQRVSTFSCS